MDNKSSKIWNTKAGREKTPNRVLSPKKIRITAITAAVAVAAIGVPFFIIDGPLQGFWAPNIPKLGAFGDFAGGILNPVLAFLVLLILLQSYELQKSMLDQAQESSSKLLFETTFFNLLGAFNKVSQDAVIRVGDGEFRGQNAQQKTGFEAYVYLSKALVTGHPPKRNSSFEQVYNNYPRFMNHYFRTLTTILKYLHESDGHVGSEEAPYAEMLKAQLTDHELIILLYYSLSDRGTDFLPLAKEFALFESVTDSLVPREDLDLLKVKYNNIA